MCEIKFDILGFATIKTEIINGILKLKCREKLTRGSILKNHLMGIVINGC
jgi:hypothetical protein